MKYITLKRVAWKLLSPLLLLLVTPSYAATIGGSIDGLDSGKSIALTLNGDLKWFNGNGSYTFPGSVDTDQEYTVEVDDQPNGQACFISRPDGIAGASNVTNVNVNCGTRELNLIDLIGVQSFGQSIVGTVIDVRERAGLQRPVTGLQLNDFSMLENNITVNSTPESFPDAEPLGIIPNQIKTVLLLDNSSSVDFTELGQLVEAAKRLVMEECVGTTEVCGVTTSERLRNGTSRLESNQYVAVYTFDGTMKPVISFSNNASTIINAIDTISRGGSSTNLYGSIYNALRLWEDRYTLSNIEKGSLFVLTDGDDTASVKTVNDVVLQRGSKDIYAVAVGGANTSKLAKITGSASRVYSVGSTFSASKIAKAFIASQREASRFHRGKYIVRYASPKRAGDHNFKVTLNSNKSKVPCPIVGTCAWSVSGDFSANFFTNVVPEIIIFDKDGAITGSANIESRKPSKLTVKTRWSNDAPDYEWVLQQNGSESNDFTVNLSAKGELATITANSKGNRTYRIYDCNTRRNLDRDTCTTQPGTSKDIKLDTSYGIVITDSDLVNGVVTMTGVEATKLISIQGIYLGGSSLQTPSFAGAITSNTKVLATQRAGGVTLVANQAKGFTKVTIQDSNYPSIPETFSVELKLTDTDGDNNPDALDSDDDNDGYDDKADFKPLNANVWNAPIVKNIVAKQAGKGRIKVSWDHLPGVQRYRFYRSDTPFKAADVSNNALVASGIASPRPDSDEVSVTMSLSDTKTWYFRVVADSPFGGKVSSLISGSSHELKYFSAIDVGEYGTCAIGTDGVGCWGSVQALNNVPVFPKKPKQISVGRQNACVIVSGGVTCWGTYPEINQNIPDMTNPIKISVGYRSACAIHDGGLSCWGTNFQGETNVPALQNPIAVSSNDGSFVHCALEQGGNVKCWGQNVYSLTNVPSLQGATLLSTGGRTNWALDGSGIIKTWGSGSAKTITPTGVPTALAASTNGGCYIVRGAELQCWGLPGGPSSALTGVKAVAMSVAHGCALADNGMSCWGLTDRFIGLPKSARFVDTNKNGLLDWSVDTDGDGMADVWELKQGLNPTNPGDASHDPDFDGVSNEREYIAGTDATDSASRPLYAKSGDLDFDGDADPVWIDPATGWLMMWEMENGLLQRKSWPDKRSKTDYRFIGDADIDRDGDTDLVWYDKFTGFIEIWHMQNGQRVKKSWPERQVNKGYRLKALADFDRDGYEDLLFYDPSTRSVQVWLMEDGQRKRVVYTGAQAATDYKFEAVADVDGDGDSDIVWRRNGSGLISVWRIEGGLIDGVKQWPAKQNSAAYAIVGAGDMDGDGDDDLVFHNSLTGSVETWLMTMIGENVAVSQRVYPGKQLDVNYLPRQIADYDGDGIDDLLWHNRSSGQVSVWLMNNSAKQKVKRTSGVAAANQWVLPNAAKEGRSVAKADIDGDGNSDLLWRNGSNSNVQTWVMRNAKASRKTILAKQSNPEFSYVGDGDIDGDSDADLFWYNTTTGLIEFWLMKNGLLGERAWPYQQDPSFKLEQIGDFNNDDVDDFAFLDSNSDWVQIWLMKNGFRISKSWPAKRSNKAYQLLAAADIDGDGGDDLIWKNQWNGWFEFWLLKNGKLSKKTWKEQSASNYQFQAVADVNGDGNADIIFHNQSTGWVEAWIMRNGKFQRKVYPAKQPNPDFVLEQVGDFDGDGIADIRWRNKLTNANEIWLMNEDAKVNPSIFKREVKVYPGKQIPAWESL